MQPGESTERLQSNTARLCKEREVGKGDGEESQLRADEECEVQRREWTESDSKQGGRKKRSTHLGWKIVEASEGRERERERISSQCTQTSPPPEEGHQLSPRTPLNKVPYPALFWANNLLCSLLTKYEGGFDRGTKIQYFPPPNI